MSENPIPEEYRRQALYAALHHHDGVLYASLHHHDGVASAQDADHDGAPIHVELLPEGHPDHDPDARDYVKRVAGALGFAMSSEGPFAIRLRPDTAHALDALRNAPDP